jgi:hypothetical protein
MIKKERWELLSFKKIEVFVNLFNPFYYPCLLMSLKLPFSLIQKLYHFCYNKLLIRVNFAWVLIGLAQLLVELVSDEILLEFGNEFHKTN